MTTFTHRDAQALHAVITDALLDTNLHPVTDEQRDRLVRAKELAFRAEQATKTAPTE